jgi:formate dehydrogenase subunit gamma
MKAMNTTLTKTLRAAALALALATAAAPAALAQNMPPAASEQNMLDYLKVCPPGQLCQGRVTIPDGKSATLMQDEGRVWEARMQGPVKWWGGGFLLAVLGLLAAFYLLRGRVRVERGLAGIKIPRFTGVERFAHWLTATSFVVLGVTGLNFRFGRSLLLPLLGNETFAWISQYAKFAHDYTSFAFMLGIALMLVMWIRQNLPTRDDIVWLKAGGGIVTRGVHPPAGKFNAGQKLIFWAVLGLGGGIAATGLLMMFPFTLTAITGMQIATFLHSLLALALIGVIFAHIYIGTLGMQGAFEAMGSGKVDLNWAKEHHSRWIEELERKNAAEGAPRKVG